MSGIDLDILGMGAAKPVLRASRQDAETTNANLRLQAMTASLAPVTTTSVTPAAAPAQLRVTEVASRFGVTTDDLGELASIGTSSINRAMFEITRAGMAFLRAQELLSLGNFGKDSECERSHSEGFLQWIESNGLAKERVYEAMRIAKFVSALPAHELDSVLALGKVKVMLLASLPQEVIDQAAESGVSLIDRAELLSTAALKEEVRTLKRREKNYEAELERATAQVARLSAAKQRLTDFLPRTEDVRAEAMALQMGGELSLNSLRKMFDSAVDDADSRVPEADLQEEHLWIAACTLASRALDLVGYMKTASSRHLPDRPLARHVLTPDEAQRWLLDYPVIENRQAAEAALRQSRREDARPRSPGRPKGSKSKSAEE